MRRLSLVIVLLILQAVVACASDGARPSMNCVSMKESPDGNRLKERATKAVIEEVSKYTSSIVTTDDFEVGELKDCADVEMIVFYGKAPKLPATTSWLVVFTKKSGEMKVVPGA